MIEIKLGDAVRAIGQAVEKMGEDFFYNLGGEGVCHYLPMPDLDDPDDPRAKTGCLVGTALRTLGVPEANLNVAASANALASELEHGGVARIDENARRYFGAAQTAQDNGSSWGQAKRTADARLRVDV